MINFIFAKNLEKGIEELGQTLSSFLSGRGNVVWLLSGGTNAPIAARVMEFLRRALPYSALARLVIMLGDERYGKIGHKDSNWRALQEAGFNFEGVQTEPTLVGISIEDTTVRYSKKIDTLFKSAHAVVGQFGIGADGHIAGILPYSRATLSADPVFYYDALPLRRITITPAAFARIDIAFVFAFGKEKREAVRRLRDEKVTIEEQPAQILKKVKEVRVYSDQL